MQLTIYLFKNDTKSFDELIDPSYKDELESIDPLQEISNVDEIAIYAIRNKSVVPAWAGALSALISTQDIENVTNSLLILARVSGRYFAVTFGHAHHTLQQEQLEPDFGLRATANTVEPSKVGAMQMRSVGTSVRHQRSETAVDSRVSDLNLRVDDEQVRFIRGKAPHGHAEIASLGGSTSLRITTELPVTKLGILLRGALKSYKSKEYKNTFPFLENFVSLSESDPIAMKASAKLNSTLHGAGARIPSKLSISLPDILFGKNVDHFRVHMAGRRFTKVENFDRKIIIQSIMSKKSNDALGEVSISAVDHEGHILLRKPISHFLVFETKISSKSIILISGSWYLVSGSYISKIDNQLKMVQNVSSLLNMPIWPKSLSEGEYNDDTANKMKWLKLDKKNITIGGPHQRVEVADLMTPDGDFICVKRLDSSATLSHLFSQAAVSAELYAQDAELYGVGAATYRSEIMNRFAAEFSVPYPAKTLRMVLAVGTDRKGNIEDYLFFFSKINLLQRKLEIERAGFEFAICKILHK